jgi:hypothetical protein
MLTKHSWWYKFKKNKNTLKTKIKTKEHKLIDKALTYASEN